MEKWKEEYENIKVPEEMKEKVEEAVARAKKQKKKTRVVRIWKSAGSMAAVLAVVLFLPNTSQTAAAAMQQIPILGDFFKVVTVREYQIEEERNQADVKVPEVVPTESSDQNEEVGKQAQQTAEEINFDIQKVTDELIEEFKSTMEEYGEEGYQDLIIDSKVLADNDCWFSLDLVLYQGAGSGYERHRHYTIDKQTGKRAVLSDFYGDDYIETISEEVKEQMKARMAADENVVYWLDSDIPEWNFREIAPDQDFYVNADGQVVICFDEYEVAPGYMGCVEFAMPAM